MRASEEFIITNIIKKLRNLAEIKQEELAEMVGVSRQTISAMENGNYSPSLQLAFQIAEVFNKTIEEVFQISKK